MLNSLARHSFVAVLLAVVIEELGIPMPIPTDVQIVWVGTMTGLSLPRLGLSFVMLTVASAVGASGLYAIVRRGGRPLVERFGRYVHLGSEQLARSEALLARTGWIGIAIGRATPGLRYPTVIACGLFKVPYLRFVTAHLAGSSVYIAVFLVLGAVFGPAILDRVHLPALGIRLLWLLPLAVGLPLLMIWWGARAHARRQYAEPSRRRAVGAVVLGGFVGATALAATWSATATAAELLGAPHPLNVTYILLTWLLGLGLNAGGISLLLYAALLSLFVGIGTAYHELVLPYVAPRGVSLPRQALGLTLLALGLFWIIFAFILLVVGGESFGLWWQTGGPIVLLGAALGMGTYAVTVVYGRALAIAVASTLRRDGRKS
jgi:membrane protein DedA with SNARE-associated domain